MKSRSEIYAEQAQKARESIAMWPAWMRVQAVVVPARVELVYKDTKTS